MSIQEIPKEEYVVDTCDLELIKDTDSGEVIVAVGTTNMNSTIEQTVQRNKIIGGIGAGTRFEYGSQKELKLNITDCSFRYDYMAFAQGGEIQNVLANDFQTEVVEVVNGIGTLATTSTLVESYINTQRVRDGILAKVDINTTTKQFNLGNTFTGKVKCFYPLSRDSRRIAIKADVFAGVYKLRLKGRIYDKKEGQSKPVKKFQFTVPNYQIDDNQTYTFDMSNPYVSTLSGTATVVEINGENVLAYADEFQMEGSESKIVLSQIASSPAVMSLAVGETEIISTKGFQGGISTPIDMKPSELTYTSGDTGIATVSVDGVVEGVGAGTTNITVNYNDGSTDYKDIVEVTVA